MIVANVPEDESLIDEIIRVRGIAKQFKKMIQYKQAAYVSKGRDYNPADLVKGTPYEKQVRITNNRITTLSGTYQWAIVKRTGDAQARLVEVKGFPHGG